jgi:hypothetical protein
MSKNRHPSNLIIGHASPVYTEIDLGSGIVLVVRGDHRDEATELAQRCREIIALAEVRS